MEDDTNDNTDNRVSQDNSGFFRPPFNYTYEEFNKPNGNYHDSSYQVRQNCSETYSPDFGTQNYPRIPYDGAYFENSYFDPMNCMVPNSSVGNKFPQHGYASDSFRDRRNSIRYDYRDDIEPYADYRVVSGERKGVSKRKRVVPVANTSTTVKKVVKSGRGLRHFSKQVCDIVRTRSVTTYLDVADKLVTDSMAESDNPANEQNIRRRVYDALNVLMALDIISKDRKQIYWRGFPSNSQCISEPEVEESDEDFAIAAREKTRMIYDMLVKVVNTKRLVKENRIKRNVTYNSTVARTAVKLPFVLISARKDSEVSCTINRTKNEVNFAFDDDFNITEDSDVLDCLGMGNLSYNNSNVSKDEILKSLPKELLNYANLVMGKSYENFHNEVMEILWNNHKCTSNDEVHAKQCYDDNQIFQMKQYYDDNQNVPNNILYDQKYSPQRYTYMEGINGIQKFDVCPQYNNLN